MDEETWNSYPLEDRLEMWCRVSSTMTLRECELMNEAAIEIRRLKEQLDQTT